MPRTTTALSSGAGWTVSSGVEKPFGVSAVGVCITGWVGALAWPLASVEALLAVPSPASCDGFIRAKGFCVSERLRATGLSALSPCPSTPRSTSVTVSASA